jgi:predicted amidohydrolase
MRGRLAVAAIQTGMHLGDAEAAVRNAEDLIGKASAKGARLVCLPEHWLGLKVLGPDDRVLDRFSRTAKELDIYANLGAVYERRDEGVFLTSITIAPDGSVISRQDKVHLYRGEKRRARAGKGFNLVEVDGSKVGVLVCHDVVFPESARSLTLGGAELILVPSLISAAGTKPWLVYLAARALENRVPLVAPNVYSPPRFMGRSSVIDLVYNETEKVMDLDVQRAPERRGFALAELDLSSKRKLRMERLSELKQGAYSVRQP